MKRKKYLLSFYKTYTVIEYDYRSVGEYHEQSESEEKTGQHTFNICAFIRRQKLNSTIDNHPEHKNKRRNNRHAEEKTAHNSENYSAQLPCTPRAYREFSSFVMEGTRVETVASEDDRQPFVYERSELIQKYQIRCR